MNIISSEGLDRFGSTQGDYAFLRRLSNWALVSEKLKKKEVEDRSSLPPLRVQWVSDTDLKSLHSTHEDPLKDMGLWVDWSKPIIAFKRLNRALRPYTTYRFFDPEKVVVKWFPDNKLWDGGGQISRKLLKNIPVFGHTDRRNRVLRYELEHCDRFEFTMINEHGTYKGHVAVVDTDEFDLYIPNDPKKQIGLTNSQMFLGLNAVHGADEMWIDIQSLINLYPFFSTEYVLNELIKYINQFIQQIQDGNSSVTVHGLSPLQIDQMREYPVMDYLVRGGHPMNSPFVVKSIIRTLTKQITNRSRENMRFPIYGGRYYIAPASMINTHIEAGHLRIQNESVICPDEEWNEISAILGGADMDDGCWCVPFINEKGEHKIIIWRSPNQNGEYWLANMDTNGEYPSGQIPTFNESDLPVRIDKRTHKYDTRIEDGQIKQGLIPSSVITGPSTYTQESIDRAIQRMRANAGTLGMYVNLLMVLTVMNVEIESLPDTLEAIIDASVKTGNQLSVIKECVQSTIESMVDEGFEFPESMRKRYIASVPSTKQYSVKTKAYWLCELYNEVQKVLSDIDSASIELQSLCSPHPKLVMFASEMKRGTLLRQMHQEAMSTDPNEAFKKVYNHLILMDDANRTAVLLGSALSCFMLSENETFTDATLWLRDATKQKTSIGAMYVKALVDVGILGDPVFVDDKCIGLDFAEESPVSCIHVNGCFFNEAAKAGYTAKDMREKALANEWKQLVGNLCQMDKNEVIDVDGLEYRGYIDQEIYFAENSDGRLLAYINGQLFGYIRKGEEGRLSTDRNYTIHYAMEHDGGVNLVLI